MADGLEDTHVRARDPFVGRVLGGKFALEAVLGEGAMGVVYLARHTALDKRVAVKLLRAETKADATRARRFKAEARAASRLDHPNSVQILDFGEDADGGLYIAMELLEGEDLQAVLRREGALSVERSAHLMLQVLAALAAAHDAGIIHRDLKPGNVMLTQRLDDDGARTDFVKVCDFGLAKILDPVDDASGAPLTKAGTVFGTPAYMSPEQARGEVVDARSDLYSCGVMLYRAVTGEPLYTAETAWGLLMKHMSEPYVPVRERRPEVPPALEAVIDRALAKDRAARFADAREMRAALKDVLRGLGDAGRRLSETGVAPLPRPAAHARLEDAAAPGDEGALRFDELPPATRAGSTRPLASPSTGSEASAVGAPVAASAPRRGRWIAAGAFALAAIGALVAWPSATPVSTRPLPLDEGAPEAAVVGSPSIGGAAAPRPHGASPSTAPTIAARALVTDAPATGSHEDARAAPAASRVAESRVRPSLEAPRAGLEAAPAGPARVDVPAPGAPAGSSPGLEPQPPSPSPGSLPAASPRVEVATGVEAPRALTRAEVELTSVRVSGGMSTRRVTESLSRLRAPLEGCLVPTLGEGAKGEVAVDASIDADGRVEVREVRGASEGARACVRARLAGAALDRPDTGEAALALVVRYRGAP